MDKHWPDIAGRLVEGTHILPVRVYYEDTDFGGGVYHSNFLKYCERGRTDFLRLLGVSHTDLSAGKYGGAPLGFAVAHVKSRFLRPAKIDDLLLVHTSFIKARGARLVLAQKVTIGEEVLYEADITVAMVDGQGRPARLPPEIAELLEKWH